jgi:hypothetical protein
LGLPALCLPAQARDIGPLLFEPVAEARDDLTSLVDRCAQPVVVSLQRLG